MSVTHEVLQTDHGLRQLIARVEFVGGASPSDLREAIRTGQALFRAARTAPAAQPVVAPEKMDMPAPTAARMAKKATK